MELKRNSLRLRLLTLPVGRTFNKEKAYKSRFQYIDRGFGRYDLRVLGVLNGLFGLTVTIKDK